MGSALVFPVWAGAKWTDLEGPKKKLQRGSCIAPPPNPLVNSMIKYKSTIPYPLPKKKVQKEVHLAKGVCKGEAMTRRGGAYTRGVLWHFLWGSVGQAQNERTLRVRADGSRLRILDVQRAVGFKTFLYAPPWGLAKKAAGCGPFSSMRWGVVRKGPGWHPSLKQRWQPSGAAPAETSTVYVDGITVVTYNGRKYEQNQS